MPVLAWFWMPAGRIDELAHQDTDDLSGCGATRADRDHARPRDRQDRHRVRLAEIAASYDLQALGFDEWRFADLAKILTTKASNCR